MKTRLRLEEMITVTNGLREGLAGGEFALVI